MPLKAYIFIFITSAKLDPELGDSRDSVNLVYAFKKCSYDNHNFEILHTSITLYIFLKTLFAIVLLKF